MIISGGRALLCAVSLVLICPVESPGQNFSPVTIILRQPLPNQVKLNDLWEVTLGNNGRTTLNVYLRGRISSGANILVTATSGTIALLPGAKTFTGRNTSELSPISAVYTDSHFKDVLTNLGAAPSGEYTLTVEIWQSGGSVTAAPGPLASSSVDQTVESTSQPLLVSPSDGTDVSDALPMFTWAMPAPLSARVKISYTVRIVELLGKQSPVAAMIANPAWYELNNIGTTTIQYSPGARSFTSGTHYAWKVSAFSFGALLGESEIWEFVYVPQNPFAGMSPQPQGIRRNVSTLDVLDELLQSCTEEITVKKQPSK